MTVRPGAVAVVSLVSAVLGGIVVLLVASALGWGDDSSPVASPADPPPSQDDATPVSVTPAKPLPGNDFDPARIYAERSEGVVTIISEFGEGNGQGSGFVVSEDGIVLTNSHVITSAGEGGSGAEVKRADAVYVEFRDGDALEAEIVGWDIFDDVGVLRVDPSRHSLTPLPLGDSSRVVVGEPVAAIGSPFGNESSLAVGVVSATRRSISALTSEYTLVDAIQTDAPINRGNSGGPLFDARGRVIGINAQIRTDTGVNEGVGFAIPINSAKRSLEQLLATGRVAYAYVGISTGDLTPGLADELGLETRRGALIVRVAQGGPADDAGLRGGTRMLRFNGENLTVGGDVVVAIDGRTVRSGDDLVRIVSGELAPGQVATFTVLRGDRFLDVPVKLAERPAAAPRG